mmetsp:Transcript_11118/g.12694  ORF Transcript_11118/g.12694 Transcript_11118/m.12694 type:complete len:84 (+) Transcript_11118:132-383(+)
MTIEREKTAMMICSESEKKETISTAGLLLLVVRCAVGFQFVERDNFPKRCCVLQRKDDNNYTYVVCSVPCRMAFQLWNFIFKK